MLTSIQKIVKISLELPFKEQAEINGLTAFPFVSSMTLVSRSVWTLFALNTCLQCPSAGFNVGLDQFMDDDLEIHLDHPEKEFKQRRNTSGRCLLGCCRRQRSTH